MTKLQNYKEPKQTKSLLCEAKKKPLCCTGGGGNTTAAIFP